MRVVESGVRSRESEVFSLDFFVRGLELWRLLNSLVGALVGGYALYTGKYLDYYSADVYWVYGGCFLFSGKIKHL